MHGENARRGAAATILVLAAVLAGPAPSAAPSTAPSPATTAPAAPADEFSLDLAGTGWRFMAGDDPAWADPAFDDAAWETAQVPQEGGQPYFADNDGYAWFRLSFTLPADAVGTPLVAALGGIDDADEAYLNGELIGRTGTFPPDEDSQWFEQRLYPVPASAPRYGAVNVLAVRMNDFTGGGGWYSGPVGLFSKAALRSTFYGLRTSLATATEQRSVQQLLARQARLVHDGRWKAYAATLSPDFFHDGDTVERRVADLQELTVAHGPLHVVDTEVQVVRDNTSDALIADVNRSIVGQDEHGDPVVVQEIEQDFLYYAPAPTASGVLLRERGDRSRFFMDTLHSQIEGHDRDFAVYLPPSYLAHPERTYPTIYLLHGINGGAAEWATRDIDERIDTLIARRGIAEAVVVMPDAGSLWYVDSSDAPWRSMFVDEMVPLVDRRYRTKARRAMRGLTGVSMGGHGAFTLGWSQPQLFSSIASHIGALDLPPLAGTPEEVAANAGEAPTVQVTTRSTEFLKRYRYFFDACQDDDYDFDDAARAMDAQLTAKQVPHRTVVYPTGRHNDACWVPHLYSSFDLHSDSFRAHGLSETGF